MPKKTRILFTIPNFKTAGSQYVVLSLFRLLDNTRFEPFVSVEKFPEIKPSIIPPNKFLYFPKKGELFKDVLKMCSQLKKNEIDVVHSWDYKSTSVEAIAAKLACKPYLYTKKNDAWSKRWFFKSIISSHVAYDNPEMKKKFFNSFLLKRKITFIPHGVDEKKFRKLGDKDSSAIVKLGCVGNINSNKNQLLIIEGIKSLPENVHLYLYGKADELYLQKIKKDILENKLGHRVHIEGFVNNDELPVILNKLDVIILASKKEGLPVSVLEALACEVPVFASDSGGGTSYIASKGEGLIIFKNNNIEDFVNKVLPFVNNVQLRKKVGGKGRDLVKNYFLLKSEVEAYESLYLKLVNEI